jgi:hypothetical protein
MTTSAIAARSFCVERGIAGMHGPRKPPAIQATRYMGPEVLTIRQEAVARDSLQAVSREMEMEDQGQHADANHATGFSSDDGTAMATEQTTSAAFGKWTTTPTEAPLGVHLHALLMGSGATFGPGCVLPSATSPFPTHARSCHGWCIHICMHAKASCAMRGV